MGDRTASTYTDLYFGIGRTFSCSHLHTRQFSGQCFGYGSYRYVFQCFFADRRYGTGQIPFTLCAIADYHHFVESFQQIFEHHIDNRSGNINFLIDFSHGAEYQCSGCCRYAQGVFSIHIGDRSLSAFFYNYCSADYRITVLICYCSGNGTLLSNNIGTQQQHSKHQRNVSNSDFVFSHIDLRIN